MIIGVVNAEIDLISKWAIDRTSNPIRRQEILSTAQTIRSQIVAIALPCTIIQIPTFVGVFFYVPATASRKSLPTLS